MYRLIQNKTPSDGYRHKGIIIHKSDSRDEVFNKLSNLSNEKEGDFYIDFEDPKEPDVLYCIAKMKIIQN